MAATAAAISVVRTRVVVALGASFWTVTNLEGNEFDRDVDFAIKKGAHLKLSCELAYGAAYVQILAKAGE